MKTILVTGGAGYIGAHTCKALAAAGMTPVVYDNLSTGHRDAVLWGPLEEGDILDRGRLDAVIAAHKPSAIVHFAALSLVGDSMQDPGTYYRNNVLGSLTLLEAMRDHGIRDFVLSSTAATYGLTTDVPIREDTPLKPMNPYGHSKHMVETMMADFETAHGLRWIALRYFNAAGADIDAQIGEDHEPESHLIPLVLDAASGRRPSITVFGQDYETPDGTCIRDYIHVEDLADAHIKALAALEAGAPSSAYNLGNGTGYSVREVIDAARSVTGLDIPVIEGPRRPGDPARLISDATRAAKELGWVPRHSDLSQIIASAWAWHQKRR